MDELIEQLTTEIPDALQSEEYENNVNSTVNSSNEKKAKLFSELERTSKAMNFGVKSTRMGIVTVPIVDGKPLSEKDYADLSEDQKEKSSSKEISLSLRFSTLPEKSELLRMKLNKSLNHCAPRLVITS